MLQAYILSVLDVPEICCKCFRCVAKVDLDVAYVAKVVHVLQASVSNISSVFSDVCCNCVYLDVAYV